MSYIKYMDDFFNSRAGRIQLGLPGQIKKIDNEAMRADVKPLFKLKNSIGESTDFPVLVDLPVLFIYSDDFYIRPSYSVDDYVWIGFSTYDIENALKGETRQVSESTIQQRKRLCNVRLYT